MDNTVSEYMWFSIGRTAKDVGRWSSSQRTAGTLVGEKRSEPSSLVLEVTTGAVSFLKTPPGDGSVVGRELKRWARE